MLYHRGSNKIPTSDLLHGKPTHLPIGPRRPDTRNVKMKTGTYPVGGGVGELKVRPSSAGR